MLAEAALVGLDHIVKPFGVFGRKAYADAVDARFKKFAAGQITVDAILDLQRRLALAQVKEYEGVAEYNNSLARFEWAKGTILVHDNITMRLAEVAFDRLSVAAAGRGERECYNGCCGDPHHSERTAALTR